MPIFSWQSQSDLDRQEKEETTLKQCGSPERFEELRAKQGLFRKPEDGLDDEWIDEYLAWKCSKKNPSVYRDLIEHCTLTEVAEIYAMVRVDAYLDEEFLP